MYVIRSFNPLYQTSWFTRKLLPLLLREKVTSISMCTAVAEAVLIIWSWGHRLNSTLVIKIRKGRIPLTTHLRMLLPIPSLNSSGHLPMLPAKRLSESRQYFHRPPHAQWYLAMLVVIPFFRRHLLSQRTRDIKLSLPSKWLIDAYQSSSHPAPPQHHFPFSYTHQRIHTSRMHRCLWCCQLNLHGVRSVH